MSSSFDVVRIESRLEHPIREKHGARSEKETV